MKNRIKIIACRVLETELTRAAEKNNITVVNEYLEAGLHDNPKRLALELQAAIDNTDREIIEGKSEYDAILIGYGICGGGTLGLQAGSIPLIIPRVHDCISLFLGSSKLYQKEFAGNPGSLYMTRDWYEHKTQPVSVKGKSREAGNRNDWNIIAGYKDIKDKYGQENAENIYEFLNSWQKNYTRSVFIDNGEGENSKYADYARSLASGLNWEYKRIEGSSLFFDSMVTERSSGDDILIVPPGHIIAWDPMKKGIYSHHPEKIGDDPWHRLPPVSRESDSDSNVSRRGLGLGIDAGGTYTDAVLYDFGRKRVLAKSKARTTRWDFTVGISNALEGLDPALLKKVDISVVSTTLATNAIVEETGRKVGLLLMPITNLDGGKVQSYPYAVVRGGVSIDGEILEPVDRDEILSVCREMIEKEGVEAFAVSGYGSTINPRNELEIKALVEDQTGMGVCCGHELSSTLNFYVRANTAVLNAGIIPLLEQFISDLEESVKSLGIAGQIMIVRGDGALMSRQKAVMHPVETTLSGPAASISGACFMTGKKDAMIIDVGGTTSDIGIIENGKIQLTEEGARVGRWRTHVKAVNMSTLGTGGDSRILISDLEIKVGPRRITPICHLQNVPGSKEALEFISISDPDYFASTAPMEILRLTGKAPGFKLNKYEKQYLDLLSTRPYSVKELCSRLELGLWKIVNTERLEQASVVERYGLTPTDLLVASGELILWDAEYSRKLVGLYEEIWSDRNSSLKEVVFDAVSTNILKTLVLQELSISGEDAEKYLADPVFKKLLMKLKGDSSALSITPALNLEFIGVGAAAPFILEKTARELGAELILPKDGDVANAVGAVTSLVRVECGAEVIPAGDGFQVVGIGAVKNFEEYADACDYLEEALAQEVISRAEKAGTGEKRINWQVELKMGKTSKGGSIFLARSYTAEVSGLPSSVESGALS
ncbi:MAG: DUF1638 domain-containing protein [Spirochaetales bacterium]|nr:DUF1638 domain-containing protein [Spirochaetales bacterium]